MHIFNNGHGPTRVLTWFCPQRSMKFIRRLRRLSYKKFIGSFAILLFLSLNVDISISSEYYQYKDKNGVVHFTDDLSEIPKDQREKVTSFESLTSEGVRAVTIIKRKKKNFYDDQSEKEEQVLDEGESLKSDAMDDKLLQTSASLQRERAELEQVFENLQKKRTSLTEMLVRKKTPEEKQTYMEKVNQLNVEIKEYEDRQKQFTENTEIYNNNVKQKNLSKAQAD